MAIHLPFYRKGKRNIYSSSSRNVVAELSLTAMVDMFTVLTIFLLQNYNVTGKVIDIPKSVELPRASQVKEVSSGHVCTLTDKDIILNNKKVASISSIAGATQFLIQPLYAAAQRAVLEKEKEVGSSLKEVINKAVRNQGKEGEVDQASIRKVTLQADKNVQYQTIKKVMYTLTEAGMYEINFAVLKKKGLTTEVK